MEDETATSGASAEGAVGGGIPGACGGRGGGWTTGCEGGFGAGGEEDTEVCFKDIQEPVSRRTCWAPCRILSACNCGQLVSLLGDSLCSIAVLCCVVLWGGVLKSGGLSSYARLKNGNSSFPPPMNSDDKIEVFSLVEWTRMAP